MGFGDVTGAKLGTLKTYLQDAADAGARFVVNCRVERVLVENGRAAGVEGTYRRRRRRAPRASSCARRRSSSPRARSTRRRCCCAPASAARPPATTCACTRRPRCVGVYDEPQQAWWGPPQSGADRRVRATSPTATATWSRPRTPRRASPAPPCRGRPARQHKDDMARRPARPRRWSLADPRPRPRARDDRRRRQPRPHLPAQRRARPARTSATALRDAGADARGGGRAGDPVAAPQAAALGARRRRGRSTTYARRVHDAPLSPFEHATFSLHHMGSARMGNDPQTSVAGPWGELHDTPGVWIGDASRVPDGQRARTRCSRPWRWPTARRRRSPPT